MSSNGPRFDFTPDETTLFKPIYAKYIKKEWGSKEITEALGNDRAKFDRFKLFAQMITASLRTEQLQNHREEQIQKLVDLRRQEAYLRQQVSNNESTITASRTANAAAAACYADDVRANKAHPSASSEISVDECAARIGQIKLNERTEVERTRVSVPPRQSGTTSYSTPAIATSSFHVTAQNHHQSAAPVSTTSSSSAASAAKPTNMHIQAQRASSASVSTATFTAPAIVATASSNNTALPPRQSAAPKLQLPPLPSSSPLKPKAPAVQARTATTSAALPSTLAAKAAAAASSSSASAATHIVVVTPTPVYLVQAKAPAKPPVSKPNAKQAPMVAPRALPPTPCHAAMATVSRSVISVPGPERNGARPSK